MYTYVKRMASPPNMDTFDASVRDVVCTRRQRTDTPLQALVTMNDVQWVEAARSLAQRVIHEAGPDPTRRVNRMSEILLAHDPPEATAKALETSLQRDATALRKGSEKPHILWLKLVRRNLTRPFQSRNWRPGLWSPVKC